AGNTVGNAYQPFSSLLQLGGLAVLGIGIWVKVDGGSFMQILGAAAPHLQQLINVGYLCIAIGAFLLLMGFLGCCGAMKESKCLLLLVGTAQRAPLDGPGSPPRPSCPCCPGSPPPRPLLRLQLPAAGPNSPPLPQPLLLLLTEGDTAFGVGEAGNGAPYCSGPSACACFAYPKSRL
uniref:Tetraspanin 1 n=1 Tax=Pelusios castaneus TaxID=367368 RepID=A0A8C8SND8_9SAUR